MPNAAETDPSDRPRPATTPRPSAPGFRVLGKISPWLIRVGPTALTFASCAYDVTARQPWRDELSTWWAVQLSPSDLFRLLGHVDAVLGLYYILMHGWTTLFGDSVFALRLPSVLLMALNTWLVQYLSTRQFGVRAGVFAGLAFAVIPNITAYGQEARPYALAVCAALLSTLALLRAREQPGETRRWILYAGSVVLLGYSHVVSLCLLFAHAALMAPELWPSGKLWPPGKPSGRRWVLATGAGLLLVVPLVMMALRESSAVDWIRADWKHIQALPGNLFHSQFIAGTFIALGLLGLVKSAPLARLLGVWALFPPLFLLATFDLLHLFLDRYMLFTLPAWAVLTGVAVAAVTEPGSSRWRLIPLGAVLLWFAVLGQHGIRDQVPRYAFDYRSSFVYIMDHAREGDAIALEAQYPEGHLRLAYRYWLRHEPHLLRDVFVETDASARGSFEAALCKNARACLPENVERLWLVTATPKKDLFSRIPKSRADLLRSQFEVDSVHSAQRIRTALLVRR